MFASSTFYMVIGKGEEDSFNSLSLNLLLPFISWLSVWSLLLDSLALLSLFLSLRSFHKAISDCLLTSSSVVITHFFLSFFAISFDYSFSSSTKLLCMNFFLFLSFSPELRFMNFDFLFTENFTLFELVFSFSRSIANFTFSFSSSLRTNCRTIASAVSEISSKVEKTPAVPFNDFCGATRKLLLLEQWYLLIYTTVSVALKFLYH